MINVLHYGLSSNLGGIETYLYKLYSNINRDEFKFDFLIIGDKEPCWYDEFISMGSRFFKVTARNKNPLKNRMEISKLLKEEKFDIVHCHLNSLSYTAPVHLALKYNVPVIVHSRNAGILKSKLSHILHTLNYLTLPRDKITMLSVSDLAGMWMFGEKANFQVINNGINVGKYRYDEKSRKKIRREFQIKEELVVVHIGAMREQKNHMFILDIFKSLLKEEPNSKLVLVGDGKLKNKILDKIHEYKIDNNIIVTGNRNDIPDILSAADIFLFPSFYEGFPNAVLEAQTSGLPCLVSDSITREVMVSENCKALSLDKNANEWAKQLLLLNSLKDRAVAADIIKSKGLSVEDEVTKIEDIYKVILKR